MVLAYVNTKHQNQNKKKVLLFLAIQFYNITKTFEKKKYNELVWKIWSSCQLQRNCIACKLTPAYKVKKSKTENTWWIKTFHFPNKKYKHYLQTNFGKIQPKTYRDVSFIISLSIIIIQNQHLPKKDLNLQRQFILMLWYLSYRLINIKNSIIYKGVNQCSLSGQLLIL
jgi:hypothetical protein